MRQNTRSRGGIYEEIAAKWLEKQGLVILERNFRCRQGEIDLIVRDGEVLVFTEIKYRRSRGTGSSIEAVDSRKQARIYRAALYYLAKNRRSPDIPCRFDVLGFDGNQITWIKNAFEGKY